MNIFLTISAVVMVPVLLIVFTASPALGTGVLIAFGLAWFVVGAIHEERD
jgi:hypothetical protein